MVDKLVQAIELLERAAEAMKPSRRDGGNDADWLECGGCGRWVKAALPLHPGPCDAFCAGSHEQLKINHRPNCSWRAIKAFLQSATPQ